MSMTETNSNSHSKERQMDHYHHPHHRHGDEASVSWFHSVGNNCQSLTRNLHCLLLMKAAFSNQSALSWMTLGRCGDDDDDDDDDDADGMMI